MTISRVSSLVLALAVVGAAQADVAYTNLPGFNEGTGWTASGESSIVGRYAPAMQFNSAVSGDITSVDFAAFGLTGSGAIKLSVYGDDGSNQLGAFMGSWNTTVDIDGVSKLYSTNAPAGISLVAGQNYWLGMNGLDDTWAAWNWTSPGTYGNIAGFFDTTPIYFGDNLGAFTVNAQAVPEPASMAVLGLGVVGVIRRRAKRA